MRQSDPKRQLQQTHLSKVAYNSIMHCPGIEPRSATCYPTTLTTVPLITPSNFATLKTRIYSIVTIFFYHASALGLQDTSSGSLVCDQCPTDTVYLTG